MRESILKNTRSQSTFERQGFVKMDLLDQEELEQLQQLQAHYFPDDSGRFFSSSYLDEFEVKQEISDAFTGIIQEKFDMYFTNARMIGAAFLIKGTGPKSEMPIHQDWTIVDEKKYYAANLWIPLRDTNERNGTLELMKGSHRWYDSVRAPSLPMPFEGHEETLKKHLTLVPADLGQVVLLNQATIHYSKPNMGSEIRPAITVGVISEEAPLLLNYYDKEREELEVFSQEDDFLLRFEDFGNAIYERPRMGKSAGFRPYQVPKISEDEMVSLLNKSSDL